MTMFVKIGTTSINLSRVACINWGKNWQGDTEAVVHFGDGEPLRLYAEDADDLSELVSRLEAQTEGTIDHVTLSLYTAEEPHCA